MVLALLAPTLIAPPVFAQSVLTRDNGAKVGDNQNSQTAGATGPTLLQDVQLIQKLQRFDRERIPERVVHARGTGVKGEFTATADLSNLTKAKVFSAGEKTPFFVGGAWQPLAGDAARSAWLRHQVLHQRRQLGSGRQQLPHVLHSRCDQVPRHGACVQAGSAHQSG
ncbi:catalase [Xanthomonas citri pv. citri]|nr:catalase [Xanthomonas citri pv. citri]APR15357.1 catalase [Xanthomonas citri pv. citri]APR21906.1 catalase [Xanthomonas citri pv. citri]APR25867.1 catalase [Xanthomonas citri pv. citri]OLR71761.1 catalase [Xanthomonas citri pv. citri]